MGALCSTRFWIRNSAEGRSVGRKTIQKTVPFPLLLRNRYDLDTTGVPRKCVAFNHNAHGM